MATGFRYITGCTLLLGAGVLPLGCGLDDFEEGVGDGDAAVLADGGPARDGGQGGARSLDGGAAKTPSGGSAGNGTNAGAGSAEDGGSAKRPPGNGAGGAAAMGDAGEKPMAGAASLPDASTVPDAGAATDAAAPQISLPDAATAPDASVPAPNSCEPGSCPAEAPHCVAGECLACLEGESRCDGNVPASCAGGQWVSGKACLGGVCVAGQCEVRSCSVLTGDCGAGSNDDCCASPLVPGGEFLRDENPAYPVALSDYRLDKYEVTVGRFRQFLAARAEWDPMAGAGAYPRAPGSGWDASWPLGTAENIRADVVCSDAQSTWTDEPGANENRPINCVNWYEAFAFCAWDGGYLPTEAQWEYAAAGGDEQRHFPWSSPATSTAIGLDYTTYFCEGDPITERCFNSVGSKPLGDGKYGHADLGGNVQEWLHDDHSDDFLDCPSGVNCLNQSGGSARLLRGGSAGSGGTWPVQVNAGPWDLSPLTRYAINGFRCAKPVAQDYVVSPEEAPGENTECTTLALSCEGKVPLKCDDSGKWVELNECEFACVDGACTDCTGDTRSCSANAPLHCGGDGFWRTQPECTGDTPVCEAGECVAVCEQQNDCGPAGNESCCQTLAVPGGTFYRRNDTSLPATVSAFDLGKFEVTVGRFREFVDAFPSSIPAEGAGAHPNIPGSGWDPAWVQELPTTREELVKKVMTVGTSDCTSPTVISYTEEPGANETRAMNCVSWTEAFAFCAWSGGRLPSLAELSFAAVGGAEQRVYPWSDPPTSTEIDASYATYDANECPERTTDNSSCITPVGSKPAGNGRWGHSDLLGNVAEFVLDFSTPAPSVCVDCVNLEGETSRALLGGAYRFDDASALENGRLRGASGRSNLAGIRCVYASQ